MTVKMATAPDLASDHKTRNRSFSWRARLDGSFFLYEYCCMDSTLFVPQLGNLIGEGSMARVYGLKDADDRVVKLSRDASFNETLLREAKIASELRHQTLLPIDDFGVDDEGLAWIILPRLSGRNIKQMALEPEEIVESMSLVADCLDVLHHSAWLHGDVKPANLLEGNEDSPVFLVDLGLASRLGDSGQSGSPAYLSPSRIAGEPILPSDDHFAFAVSLFELLSGHLPFVKTEGEGLLHSILKQEVHPLSTLRPALPQELDEIFSRAFSMKGFDRGILSWMDPIRRAFGLMPAAASLFYGSPEVSDGQLLTTIRDFFSQPFEGDTQLGKVVLLQRGGLREAEVLREQLGVSSPALMHTSILENPRRWIESMESLRSANESPHSAIVSSLELGAEVEAYLLHRSDTLLLETSQWRLDDLPSFLEKGLFTCSSESVALGNEELRFLQGSCHGDLAQAEEALIFLIDLGLLKAESGYARFLAPFADWEFKWQGRIRREGLSKAASRLLEILSSLGAPLREHECRDIMSMGENSIAWIVGELREAGCLDSEVEEGLIQVRSHRVEGDPDFTLKSELFPKLWDRCGKQMESKLLLLAQALKQEASLWLSSLPAKEILKLADDVSLSSLARFCLRISRLSLPGSLGILPCVERLRSRDLPESLKIFWLHEAQLELTESAELSRRLVNDLIDLKNTDEGLECQERWKQVRGKEIAGTEFEVRVAAREAMSHGRMGSMDSALELLERYKTQFAGRDGFYYLDWAEGLIHRDRRDRVATAKATLRALEGMPGDAELRDRFSLHIQLSGTFTLLGDHDQALIHLDHAEALMRQSKNLALGVHVTIARGLYEKSRGNLAESTRLYFLAIHQAKAEGSWQVPMVIQTNLVYALLRSSDFSRLMPLFREISRQVEVTDQISNASSGRMALAWVYIAIGRYEEGLKHLNEYLALADETGSRSAMVRALLRRAYLFRIWNMHEAAKADLDRLAKDFKKDMSVGDFLDMRSETLLCGEANLEELEEEELAAIIFATKKVGKEILHGEALLARVILRRRRGDLRGAQSACEEALDHVTKLDVPSLLWPIYSECGEIAMQLGDRSVAHASFGKAMETIEGLSRRFSSQEDSDRFLSRPDRVHVLKRYRSLD